MIKKVVLVAFVCYFTFYWSILDFLRTYIGYQVIVFSSSKGIPIFFPENKTKEHALKASKTLEYLHNLSEFELVGGFFMEDQILELAKANNWTEVQKQAEKAVAGRLNEKTFSIWYHKGLAECIQKKIEECEESALMAQYLSNRHSAPYVKELHQFVKMLKRLLKNKEKALVSITNVQGKDETNNHFLKLTQAQEEKEQAQQILMQPEETLTHKPIETFQYEESEETELQIL